MDRFKGVTYQMKDNVEPTRKTQYIPKAITPHVANDLNLNFGSQITNQNIRVPVTKILKVPCQKYKLLKSIEGTRDKSFDKINKMIILRRKDLLNMHSLLYIAWIQVNKITFIFLYL